MGKYYGRNERRYSLSRLPFVQKESDGSHTLAIDVTGADGTILGFRIHETSGVSLYEKSGDSWKKLWDIKP